MERSETSLDISGVFSKALDLIDSRESMYGFRWREEPISQLYENVFRKADGVKFSVVRNHKGESSDILENLLDLINYTAFVFRRVSDSL